MKTLFRSMALALVVSTLNAGLLWADSAFEDSTSPITRTAFQLYGCQLEGLSVSSSGVVCVACNSPNGAFCSSTQGSVWQCPPSGTDMGSIAAISAGADGDTFYAIGGISLYKTTDAGASWTELAGSSGLNGNNFGSAIVF